jgi:hypothetical protein
MREIFHAILPVKLLQDARHDCASWMQAHREGYFAKLGRIRLSLFQSQAIGTIVDRLAAHANFPFRPDRSGVQLQKPDGAHQLGWHQDWVAIGNRPGITAWVPLDSIDGTRPTLEFAGAIAPIPHHEDEHGFMIADLAGKTVVSTVVERLELGDVVMFSPLELHRTYCDGSMTQARMSLDLRFVSELS